MVDLLTLASLLVEDALRWVLLLFRSAETLRIENLFLRRQLALYIERGVQPQRVDAATRVSSAPCAAADRPLRADPKTSSAKNRRLDLPNVIVPIVAGRHLVGFGSSLRSASVLRARARGV
jgi:hypothetical protein